VALALAIGASVAFCGHPGRQSAERQAAPSPSGPSRASSWAFQYVHFVTLSDGWAMAGNDQSGFTYLFTSHDGGRGWHNVTPPVVVAGEEAFDRDQARAAIVEPQTPFVLDSRDAWLPVMRSYGYLDQSSELYVYMTSDAGRRWALRGAVPGGRVGRDFFPKPVYRFHRNGEGRCSWCGHAVPTSGSAR
jgi:hypothetical protein